MDRDTILDAMTAERRSGLAGDGETFSLGFTLVHEGPRLHEMVFVENGNGEGGHVAFVGRLGAGEAEESEIELAVGGGRGGGLHGGLIAHGAVVGYEDAVAIKRVHGDHVGFVAGVEALHQDAAVGNQFIGNLHLLPSGAVPSHWPARDLSWSKAGVVRAAMCISWEVANAVTKAQRTKANRMRGRNMEASFRLCARLWGRN